jgi:OmpA family
MKAKQISLLVVLLIPILVSAQQICSRSSFYFNKDEAELTAVSRQKIDSILLVTQQSQFLIELYGHTDTTGNTNYNDRLAFRRMKTIESYLDSAASGRFQYKEKNFSETNAKVSQSTERNLAFNRRVDLFLLPLKGGMIQLKGGKKSESVEVPLNYFEPCGLCGNQPAFKSYYNEKDTKGTNITFQTNDGYKLETAGTMMLDYTPCDGVRKKDTAAVVFRICDGKPDEKMTLWQADTVNGKIVWKPSANKFVLDPRTGCYVFRAPAGALFNLDKIDYDTIFSFETPEGFAYTHVIIRDKKNIRYNSEQDSICIAPKDTNCMVHSFAKKDNQVYLLALPIDSIPDTLKREGRIFAQEFNPPLAMYDVLTYSDTILKIRSTKSLGKAAFGFYLPEYKEFIPIDSASEKYAMGQKPNCKYQYAYIKGNSLYVINSRNVNPKYSSSSNTELIKINRKNRKKFHRVNDYRVKKDQSAKKAKR